jgi:hypothetical protein
MKVTIPKPPIAFISINTIFVITMPPLKNSITVILLLLSILSFAQNDTVKRHKYLCINAGLGIPAGDFGYNNDNGICANEGNTYNACLGFPIKKTISDFIFMLGYNCNSFDFPTEIANEHSHFPATAVSWGSYSEVSAMAGFSINIPKNWQKVCFYFRFMAGASETFYPYLIYYSNNGPYYVGLFPSVVYVNSFNRFGMGFGAGAGIKVLLTEKVFIEVSADYLLMGPPDNVPAYEASEIDLLNVTGGIGIQLGK